MAVTFWALICNLFMLENKIVIRTLGRMIEVNFQQTAENLKEQILAVLMEYEINLLQVYCVTTDNGANMLKAIKLLKEAINNVEMNPNDNETIDNEELRNAMQDDLIYSRIDTLLESSSIGLVTSVRCASHTLQLVVHDVIKQYKNELSECREYIKKLRTGSYKNLFATNKKKKPILDVPTRWSSTYEMVNCLLEEKDFVIEITQSDPKVNISAKSWEFLAHFRQAFHPVMVATKKLQKEQFVMGDFYKTWLECDLLLKVWKKCFNM